MANSGAAATRVTVTYWPRWLLAVLIASGIIVILAETTNLLVLVGILFIGAGIYGAFHTPRAPGGRAPLES